MLCRIKGNQEGGEEVEADESNKTTMKNRPNHLWNKIAKSPFLYVMALPGLIFVLIFNYLPMYGVLIAFKDFNIAKGIIGSEWVGFSNFDYFFSSDQFKPVVFNTLYLNFLFILFTTVLSLMTALLLNEIRHKFFKRLTQSIIFLPFFMSWVVVGMIVDAFLGGQHPMMTRWLSELGIPEINWYFEAYLWPWILTIIKMWQASGYYSIIYLAVITGISEELYEAAKIDGASRLQSMLRITLPLMIPTISILSLLQIGRIFNGDFAMIYAIVGDNSMLFPTTDVIDTFVYRSMRVLNDFGMSTAVGLFQSAMGFIFVVSANWLVKRISKESALF
jgi:putative aldouronate transport system permease protein